MPFLKTKNRVDQFDFSPKPCQKTTICALMEIGQAHTFIISHIIFRITTVIKEKAWRPGLPMLQK